VNQTITPSEAKSWPFQEARKLLDHITRKGKKPGDTVTFETGYGPSGAPHIGTFAEVVRTLWVMKAFDAITASVYNARLILFSDDYDAMRKVPEGLPEWMREHLGKPLSAVPSPDSFSSGTFASDNNMKLIEFVDSILKDYNGSVVGSSPNRSRVSFVSSTEYYKAGKFNDMLDRVWDSYDKIQAVMLPTLGEERRATYSPFMPVVPVEWGPVEVLQVPVNLVKVNDQRQISFVPPFYADSQTTVFCGVTDGRTKLQWKVDWAMRWTHFDVDYEMSGKDLIDSVKASAKICRILGGTPPAGMTYELFLDAEGKKISKTVGNGFSIEEWLTYGSTESLMMFLFQNPKAAKPLFIDLVPKMEDEFIKMAQKSLTPNDAAWFFNEQGSVSVPDISHSLLLNLAIVSQASDPNILLGYLEQTRPIDPSIRSQVFELATRVTKYAEVSELFNRDRRTPTAQEAQAFSDLATRFSAMVPEQTAEEFQYQVYEVGKAHNFEPLRDWFKALYECLLGSSDGPRFGAFTEAYGLRNTIDLLTEASEKVS
jgi:lysyl-tRNA synthetase class 1